MKILTYQSDHFWRQLEDHLFIRDEETSSKIEADVKSIIKEIREYGDDKVIQFAQDFDKITIKKDEIKLPNLKNFYSLENLNNETVKSFRLAIQNVRKFHQKQYPSDYEISNMDAKLKSIWKSMDSVGLYVPGGNTVYPSSLIMSSSRSNSRCKKNSLCNTSF